MRITNSILHRTAGAGVARGLQQLEEATRRATTGLRVERPSDDPAATSAILTASSSIRAIEQYRRNLSAAESRLAVEDDVLWQLSDLVSRARELGVGQSGETATAATRRGARLEVDGILESVRNLGNIRLGETWVFGGDEPHRPPFGDDPGLPIPGGDAVLEVGPGRYLPGAHSARTVFQDTGVMAGLSALSDALERDDQPAIAGALRQLDAAHASVQELVAEVGARTNGLEVTRENLAALDLNLRIHRSDLQDVEMEEAISQLVRKQVGYQTALAANARILSLNLTDYLR